MEKFRKVLGGKIHRATITGADLQYEGSLTLPPELMEAADIKCFEAVQVWNVTRGTRLETYAITGAAGSNDICSNGAAAHLVKKGDLVIIAAFIHLSEDAIKDHKPCCVFVDQNNRIARISDEVPGPTTPSAQPDQQ